MQNLKLLGALAALVMTATTMTACGGNECASGTTEKDGQCVPTSTNTLTCGEGTMLAEGQCVPTSTTMCGAGTVLMDGACVPTSTTECGDGTMLVGGECVPTSTITCGTGTMEQNGACVPTSTITCGAGTMESNGACVVAAPACGAGTQLDANSGTCIVTDMVCGTGTAFTNGACIPTDAVCAMGTTFNAMTGTCLPEATCEVGDVVLNGVCVSPAAQLVSTATVQETENNDPSLGGAAQALTLPAAGTQLVVAGAIGVPADLDNDMALDQDSDAFTVTLAAGDLIQLSVQPVAGPSLGFVVFGPDGSNYTRSSTLGLTQGAARQIFAPVAGEYTVIVAPAVTLAGNAGPIGNADWKYALTAETLAAPTATDVDATGMTPITGQFANLNDNLFRATNLTGGLSQITVGTIGANAEGVYYVGSSLTTMTRVFPAITGGVQTLSLAAGENLVFFDWTEVNGPDTAFSATAGQPANLQDLGALTDMLATSTPVTLASGDSYYYTFTGTPGQVLRLGQSNTEVGSVTVNIAEADSDPVTPFGAAFGATNGTKVTLPRTLSTSVSNPAYLLTRLDSATTYLVTVTNTSATAARTNFTLNAKLNAITDLGTKAVGEAITIAGPALTLRERSYHKVTFAETVRLSGTLTSPSGDPDLFVYKADGELLCSGNSSVTNCTATAGDYYIEVDAFSAVPSFGLSFTTSLTPVAEIEPNNDAATATATTQGREGTGSFGNADADFFAITVPAAIPAGSALRVNVVPTATTGATPLYTCTLRDSAGTTVATSTSINDCVLFGGALAAGTYTLELSNSAATASNYSFNTSVITGFGSLELEPNNDAATANALTIGSTIFGESAPGATVDSDVYGFTLAADLGAGELLTAAIGATTGRSNTASFTIELRDSTNTLITSGATISRGGLVAGAYTLTVRRSTSSTTFTGRYSLSTSRFTPPSMAEFSEAVATAIPDNNATGITRTLSVAKPGCVISATYAFINITHEYKGDATVTLVAPDNTTVILHNKTGSSALDIIETYPVTVAPNQSLNALNGKAASGTWTLRVSDTGSGDTGTLNSWGLAFTCAP